jgi:hypothetical protein
VLSKVGRTQGRGKAMGHVARLFIYIEVTLEQNWETAITSSSSFIIFRIYYIFPKGLFKLLL